MSEIPKAPSLPTGLKTKWFSFNASQAVTLAFFTLVSGAFNKCSSNTADLERKLDKVSEQVTQQGRDFQTFRESYQKDMQSLSNEQQIMKVQIERMKGDK